MQSSLRKVKRKNFNQIMVLAARILLLIAFIATLYFALTQSDGKTARLIPWDKAVHYICFVVLTGLSIVSFPKTNLFLIALVIGGFGWLIEYLQGLELFSRDKDIWDWVAEIFAIITVYCAIWAGHIRQKIQSI